MLFPGPQLASLPHAVAGVLAYVELPHCGRETTRKLQWGTCLPNYLLAASHHRNVTWFSSVSWLDFNGVKPAEVSGFTDSTGLEVIAGWRRVEPSSLYLLTPLSTLQLKHVSAHGRSHAFGDLHVYCQQQWVAGHRTWILPYTLLSLHVTPLVYRITSDRGDVTRFPIILKLGGTEQTWCGAKTLLPGIWLLHSAHFIMGKRWRWFVPNVAFLVQNSFNLFNCTGSQVTGPLCWATNEHSMSIRPTVYWKDCREAPGREIITLCAWEYSKNQQLKFHCRHHEGKTSLKTGNMVKRGFLGYVPHKVPPVSHFIWPCAMSSSTLSQLRTETSMSKLFPECPEMLIVSRVGERQAGRGRE